MKYFIMEPSIKKSLVENTIYKRVEEDGKTIFLKKELGWRWGSWIIHVPETQEEIDEYIQSKGYDNIEEFAIDYGHTYTNEDGDEVMVDGFTLQEVLVPDENLEMVDVTEDYPDAEFVSSWDACWEFWHVYSYQKELDDEVKDALAEEANEAYINDYGGGVESLGWELADETFELQCNPVITPCDENGVPLPDAA